MKSHFLQAEYNIDSDIKNTSAPVNAQTCKRFNKEKEINFASVISEKYMTWDH